MCVCVCVYLIENTRECINKALERVQKSTHNEYNKCQKEKKSKEKTKNNLPPLTSSTTNQQSL